MPTKQSHERRFAAITLAALALILYLRLIPFVFVWDGRVPFERIQWRPLMLLDIPFNILTFVPFGFGLAGLLARRDPTRAASPALGRRVVVAGVLLSTALEAAQVFMPDRVSSLADIAANGLGVLFGYGLFRAWEMGIGLALERYVTRRNLLIGLALYALGVAVLTVHFYRSANLDNWDTTFPLVVGSEATGERPWSGRVDYLELVASFGHSPEYAARYRFSGDAPFEDIAGVPVPPLAWREGPAGPQDELGVNVGPGEWLATAVAFSGFAEAARRTDEFTVAVGVTPAATKQWGPARIASISADANRRNFTLGQREDALILRLRTPSGGQNGQTPEVRVLGVFVEGQERHIVVHYDAPLLSVGVDGETHLLSLAPGVAFFSHIGQKQFWQTAMAGNPYRYDIYYGLLMVGPAAAVVAGLLLAKRVIRRRG